MLDLQLCKSACRVSLVLRFLPERVVPGPLAGPSENKPDSPGLIEYTNGLPPTTK